MRRFEQNHPSLFDVLEVKHAEPNGLPPRPTARRPPMRPRPVRRALAWWTAAVLTLAGASGLSLLWHAQEDGTSTLEASAPVLLEVAPAPRWTPHEPMPREPRPRDGEPPAHDAQAFRLLR